MDLKIKLPTNRTF